MYHFIAEFKEGSSFQQALEEREMQRLAVRVRQRKKG